MLLDKEMLEFLKPKIFVKYQTAPNVVEPGNFNYVPMSTYIAHIYQSFPMVGANGNMQCKVFSFDIYVGKSLSIQNMIVQTEDNFVEEKLISLKEQGYTKIVIPTPYENQKRPLILPVKEQDKICSNYDELVTTIKNIYDSYNSANITIQNAMGQDAKNKQM